MLMASDNFRRNWYGWATNQWGHAILGQMLFIVFMAVSFFTLGEFAYRSVALSVIVIGYLAFEFLVQKGENKWDSIEDSIFVCVYGAGSIAVSFREVDVGSPEFCGDLTSILPLVGFFALHTCLGVLVRIWKI